MKWKPPDNNACTHTDRHTGARRHLLRVALIIHMHRAENAMKMKVLHVQRGAFNNYPGVMLSERSIAIDTKYCGHVHSIFVYCQFYYLCANITHNFRVSKNANHSAYKSTLEPGNKNRNAARFQHAVDNLFGIKFVIICSMLRACVCLGCA